MDQQEGETVTHRDTLKIIIRDFTVSCSIGVSDGERRKPQRLCLNLTLEVAKPTSYDDDFSRVVDYGAILGQIRRVVAGNDTLLLETLADRILRVCMSDERVLGGKLRIEKLDRYAELGGLGIELQRHRNE
jgi:FolB domain-containing protein|tara:strand:- start:16424 stop:16816 length:393 start_codon:yes stop_codon:yes gene_type:complete